MRMKGVVYKTCVCGMLTYGAETWAMKARVSQRLRATERRLHRMICEVTLKDMVERGDWESWRRRVVKGLANPPC